MTPGQRIAERARTVYRDTAAGSLRIRPPRATDGPAVHALVLAVLGEGRWFVSHPDEQPYDAAGFGSYLLDEAARANSVVRVGTVAGDVTGLVVLAGGRARRLVHIARLEVQVGQAYRGKGVGRALVEHSLDVAESIAHLHKISLAVFADNTAAICLYNSLGFAEEGRRLGEYIEADGRLRDDVLMWRSVGPLSPAG